MMDDQVKEISDFLITTSAHYSNFHPIDRFFLEPYIQQIESLDRNEFLLYNFELVNPTYVSYLLLCLPELWENITVDDLYSIVRKFTNDFSYFTFIDFTYKFLEVNSIKMILELSDLSTGTRTGINSYIQNQYQNFIKDETDYFFFDIGVIGVENDEWMYIKQRLLVDKRIEPALLSIEELKKYVEGVIK
jgi:hypothetical protein